MDMNFENRFWLQILGDHMRFIENSLAAKEVEFLERTKTLKKELDNALFDVRKGKTVKNIPSLVAQVKQLKSDILAQQIAGKIEIALPPTFINHTLNELEEYERVLQGELPHVLASHYLWGADAAGHAISLVQSLDPTEKKLMKELKKSMKCFDEVFKKSIEYTGYLRSGVDEFPAIEKLNKFAEAELIIFTKILETLLEERLDLTVLGRINPLLIQHMIKEESYYLSKVNPNLPLPIDPTSPRIEI